MMRSTAAQLLCFLSTINVVLARELASRNKTVLLGLTKTQLMIGVPVAIGVVGLIAFGIWHFFFKVVVDCNNTDGETENSSLPCACSDTNNTKTICNKTSGFCHPDGQCTKTAKATKCEKNQYVLSGKCTPCAAGSTRDAGDDASKEDTKCTVNCPGSALDTECKNSSEENVDCPEGSVCIAANNSAGVCADKNVCATAKS